jgi:hypothetical protein
MRSVRPNSLHWAILVGILTLGGSTAHAAEHPKIDPQKGWQRLFNGTDLTGWQIRDTNGRPAPEDTWVVEDGTIARKGSAYLWSERRFGDFILDLEFKVAPQTNSGIILRHLPEYAAGTPSYWWKGLLEVQILDSHGKEKPGMHDCGSLYDMIAPAHNTMKKPGEWNRTTITCRGSEVAVVMNGREIINVDLDDWDEAGKNPDGTPNKYHEPMKDLPREGHILLQDHGRPVWFRSVYVKTLD